MNSIVIICDDKTVGNTLKSNLMLLRKFDVIITCDFLNAEETVYQNKPKLVIYYSSEIDEKFKDLACRLNKFPILFVTEGLDDEMLLDIYDAGIYDYMTTSCTQTEFLVKVMSCLKRSTEVKKGIEYADILKGIGIINKDNDFYSKKYTPAIFKNLVKKYMTNGIELSIMAVAPDINAKNKCNFDYLAVLLKQNLREDDLIGYGNEKLYILMPNTNYQGALEVYNKVKKLIEDSYTISAGILKIEKDMEYKLINQKLEEALEDALYLKNTAVVQEDLTTEPPMNWLDKPNKKHKNFKLFKKVFMKKLETVITPVFYQKQQVAEQRLFESEIKQSVGEKKSIFSIEKDNIHSLMEITYPGAVKINIDIYKNVNENSEPKRQSYDLAEVNEKLIGNMLDKMIRDFQRADK